MTKARLPPSPLTLVAYRAAARLATPLAAPLLAARARRGKEDPRRLNERLGHASRPRPEGPLAWMHAASVGESISLLPLIEALAVERPDLGLLVTTGTRASAEVMAQRLPPVAVHQYAPVDTPAAVGRFLAHWRPELGVFVESELWPNLIWAARRSGARLALVSARMTERSAKAWRSGPSAVAAMLRSFDLILAQDATTEARLVALGGKVAGQLNLKRLGAPLAADPTELGRLRAAIGERTVVAAISTHEGEEQIVAEAALGLPGRPLIVIAPRHPQRGRAIAGAVSPPFATGEVALRSAGQPIGPATRVYVADTLGELGLVLGLARLAVVGKSFGPATGGHNPLEPARLGVGVVSGPHVANFADLYAEMDAAGAAIMAQGAGELGWLLAGILGDPVRLATLSRAALDFARRQEGRLGDALDLIRPLLPAA